MIQPINQAGNSRKSYEKYYLAIYKFNKNALIKGTWSNGKEWSANDESDEEVGVFYGWLTLLVLGKHRNGQLTSFTNVGSEQDTKTALKESNEKSSCRGVGHREQAHSHHH